jgi:hypothetical protein
MIIIIIINFFCCSKLGADEKKILVKDQIWLNSFCENGLLQPLHFHFHYLHICILFIC